MLTSLRAALIAGAALAAFSAVGAPIASAQSQGLTKPQDIARPVADAPYWDASLPVERRVADLMARMTVEEKLAQMISLWTTKAHVQSDGDSFDPAKASALYPDGIGFFTRPSDRAGPGSPRINPPRSIEESVGYEIGRAHV